MKFTCDQKTLVKALNTVARATSTRTTLPITKCVLIEAEGNMVTFTATNLNIAIEQKVLANIEEPGKVAIEGGLLTDIIKKMPEAPISFTRSEGVVDIKAGDIEFHLVAFEAEEFPNMKSVKAVTTPITLDREIFTSMIKQTIFATSKDESKGSLTALKVEIEDGTATIVAVDGFRLAVRKEPVEETASFEFLVPGETMEEVSRISNESPDIKISLGESMSSFLMGDVTVFTRLHDPKTFVDWKRLIPTDFTTVSDIEVASLKGSMERVSIFAENSSNSLVKFAVNGDITLTSRSEAGNVREIIPANTDGSSIEIGFNARYLIDAIRAVSGDTVKMRFTENVKPALLVPTEGDKFIYMILPVRI